MLRLRRRPARGEGRRFGATLLGLGVFLAVYALFDALPIVLPKADVVRGVRWGDLIDAPLLFLLVAAYILIGVQAGTWRGNLLRGVNGVALLVLAQGHGIHLAANTISAYLEPSAEAWPPAYFLDEHWGHAEIHLGIIFQALIFIVAANATFAAAPSGRGRVTLALLAVTYGLFLTADALEGQTVPLMLPAAIGLALLGFLRRRRPFSAHRTFFATALATTTIALIAYAAWHGGSFPEHDWHVWQLVLDGPDECC